MTANGTRYEVGPTLAVSSAGIGLGWSDGFFYGPPAIIRSIDFACAVGLSVTIYGREYVVDSVTEVGALAALFSVHPGRTVITQAPDELIDYIRDRGYPHSFLPTVRW